MMNKVGVGAIIYAVYAAIIPLNMIMNFTGATINRYVGMLVIVVFMAEISVGKTVYLKRSALKYLLLYIWCVLTIAWSINRNRTESQLFTFSFLIVILILSNIRDFSQKELELIKNSMVVSSAFIFFYLAPNLEISYSRGTLTSSAGSADANGLAANLLFCLWIGIHLLMKSRNRLLKVFYSICCLSILGSIFSTGSRGAILALVISAIVVSRKWIAKRLRALTIKDAITAFLVVSLLICGVKFILHNTNVNVIERISLAALKSDGGSGRAEIWRGVFRVMLDHPIRSIIGFGFGCEGHVCDLALGVYSGIHNVYIEYWATTGLVGLTMVLYVFYRKVQLLRSRMLSEALLVSLMVLCVPLGFFMDKGTWNVLLLTDCDYFEKSEK